MKTLVAIQSFALVVLSIASLSGSPSASTEWEPFTQYRLGMAETWTEAADRATGFSSDAAARDFIKAAAEQHRKAAFAESLGAIEETAYVDGEWQPERAADIWREFASKARGE